MARCDGGSGSNCSPRAAPSPCSVEGGSDTHHEAPGGRENYRSAGGGRFVPIVPARSQSGASMAWSFPMTRQPSPSRRIPMTPTRSVQRLRMRSLNCARMSNLASRISSSLRTRRRSSAFAPRSFPRSPNNCWWRWSHPWRRSLTPPQPEDTCAPRWGVCALRAARGMGVGGEGCPLFVTHALVPTPGLRRKASESPRPQNTPRRREWRSRRLFRGGPVCELSRNRSGSSIRTEKEEMLSCGEPFSVS